MKLPCSASALVFLVACSHRPAAAPKPEAWLDQAFAADIVYLGEKHDNPEHHRQQAQVLEALAARGATPAVVLEMVDEDEQATLDALAKAGTPAAGYRAGLGWEQRGWPDFAMYEPIFQAAVAHHLPIVAGNAAKADVKKLAFQGADAELGARYGLDVPLPAADESSLEAELAASHCNMMPASAMAPMALAQRARDYTLARHAFAAPAQAMGPRSVVIAGVGHVRRDRGAPLYVARRAPALRQYVIAYEEAGRTPQGALYDRMVTTPIANDEDHCKDFGKHPAK